MQLSELTDEETIAHYMIEQSPRGIQLAYDDYALIRSWLLLCPELDTLLHVLSEVTCEYKKKYPDSTIKPKLLNRSLFSRLKRHAHL